MILLCHYNETYLKIITLTGTSNIAILVSTKRWYNTFELSHDCTIESQAHNFLRNTFHNDGKIPFVLTLIEYVTFSCVDTL